MTAEKRPGIGRLQGELLAVLDEAARAWLDGALSDAAAGSKGTAGLPAWEVAFAAAGRRCGPGGRADTARVLLLHAARPGIAALTHLYTRGSADERRAVLLALPHLPHLGDQATPLLEDALRANDTRLAAAALGPYAAAHLPPHAWRHAVLKCLFTGVPVDAVASLADRAAGDTELARMLTAYADERTAAGRPVPDDLHRVLALAAKES